MTDTFEVGQKVRHSTYGDGEITYGPFRSTFGEGAYLVRREDGIEKTWFGRFLSAIPETPTFSVGDVVTLATRADLRATVEYGPFDDRDVYVVKLADEPTDPDEIRTFTSMAHVMTKVADPEPIKVGDRVRVVKDDPETKPGVFNGRTGKVLDVLEGADLPYRVRLDDPSGLPSWSADRWWVTDVERVTDESTYTHDGVTYDLSAKYRDTDGDVWEFTGKRRDGAPCVTYTGYFDNPDTIVDIARHHGPLTRVTN
ncbi:phiSA1p31-related protein [Streptomyces hawaiiensis]|uniref:phiSA1p31-related protein n=1 Tax=Streptomyces hawaiiensis TaxID=67305 RepID=UPI003667A389